MKKYLILCILVLFFVIKLNMVYASDVSLGREGEIIRPLDSTQVSLLQEEITVHLNIKKAGFSCKSIVKNNGPGLEMFVGYPAEEINKPEKTIQTFHDFAAYIDNKNVPFMESNSEQDNEIPNNPHYNKWFLWPLILDKGQIKEVINVFWTENTHDSAGNTVTGFVLKPAKYWYNTPGKILVKYIFENLEPYDVNSVLPANFSFQGNDLVFKTENKIPASDIKIAFNPYYEYQILGLPLSEITEFLDAKNNHQYDYGLKSVDQFLKKNIISQDAKNALSVQKGILFFEKGNFVEAEKLFQVAINKNVNLSAPYYHLCEILQQKKDLNALQKLYDMAVNRHIDPIVLRKIEATLPTQKSDPLPEVRQINIEDNILTAEIEDKKSNLERISMEVWSNESPKKPIILDREINLEGQTYRYHINEKIELPLYIANAYCRLSVYNSSGKKVEKIIPISNRRNKLLSLNKQENSFPFLTVILIILLLINLMIRKAKRKSA